MRQQNQSFTLQFENAIGHFGHTGKEWQRQSRPDKTCSLLQRYIKHQRKVYLEWKIFNRSLHTCKSQDKVRHESWVESHLSFNEHYVHTYSSVIRCRGWTHVDPTRATRDTSLIHCAILLPSWGIKICRSKQRKSRCESHSLCYVTFWGIKICKTKWSQWRYSKR